MTWMEILLVCIVVFMIVCLISIWHAATHFHKVFYRLSSDKISKPVKFVLLSDLHDQKYGKDNEKLLQAIYEENPDAVLVAGDMLTALEDRKEKVAEHFIQALAERYTIYYGLGNHEAKMGWGRKRFGNRYEEYMDAIKDSGAKVLRNEWGFDGVVMTDWGATHDRVEGVKAGLDLDMPGGVLENRRRIVKAVRSGELPMEVLDRAVENILSLVQRFENAPEKPSDSEAMFAEHLELAVEMACDCAVLLKNNGALPLTDQEPILVVGELFEKMRYQGAGSSGINPAHLISPKDAFDKSGMTYEYTRGYREMSDEADEELENEVLTAAKNVDTVLFFGGLTELFESEGYDRKDLSMPANQLSLIRKLCDAGKRVTVILFGGSPVELPFADDVTAILNMALPGEGGGEAVRRVLYGEAEPGGRLSETWMKTCGDIPFGDSFSKTRIEKYRENIYVGYRFYDEAPEKIRYPFGYGLTYTSFVYHDFEVRQEEGQITAEVTVENVGERSGSEVVQLYAGRNAGSAVFKARKGLKAFEKVRLEPGESCRVTLTFPEADLAYYNTGTKTWVLENGEYPIQIAASARDIKLSRVVTISGQPVVKSPYSDAAVMAYREISRCEIPDEIFAETVGYPVPGEPDIQPYTVESPINDFRNSRSGRFVYSCITKGIAFTGRKIDQMPEGTDKDDLIKNNRFILELIPRNCMRSLIQSSGGIAQMNVARAVTAFANGKYLKGLFSLMKKEKAPPLPIKKR